MEVDVAAGFFTAALTSPKSVASPVEAMVIYSIILIIIYQNLLMITG